MSRILPFGQHEGTVSEFGHVVADVRIAAEHFSKNLGIGPWLVMEEFEADNMHYLGEPTSPRLRLAFAFTGTVFFELVEQLDETPSVFNRENRLQSGAQSAFHHWARLVDDYDGAVQTIEKAGGQALFTGCVPDLGNSRFAYFEPKASIGGLVEVFELTPEAQDLLVSLKAASDAWDHKSIFLEI